MNKKKEGRKKGRDKQKGVGQRESGQGDGVKRERTQSRRKGIKERRKEKS